MAKTPDFDDLAKEYEAVRPQYEAFTASLDTLIRTLLETEQIEFAQIETRTKSLESLSGKVQREDKQGKYNSLADLTDLVGVRIIAYLQEDCDKIGSMLEEAFQVDELNSVRKEDELDPDKFGYLSTHYVVSLPQTRLALPEFRRFEGMKCEVQVRTLLQHTWAAIDWKFRYKEEREAPRQLRRRLFRISALLEAADNEFSAVKVEIDSLRKQYIEAISRSELDIAINTESLMSYASESSVWKSIVYDARAAGMQVVRLGIHGGLEKLSKTLEILGITKLDRLELELNKVKPRVRPLYEFIVSNRAARSDRHPQLIEAAIVRYVLYAFTSAAKQKAISASASLSPGYVKTISDYLEQSSNSK
jgi:ppGpp synthetase/RelA/SpoT-type nucleotidyltranferase